MLHAPVHAAYWEGLRRQSVDFKKKTKLIELPYFASGAFGFNYQYLSRESIFLILYAFAFRISM
jgi:hypothetical protein